MEFINLNEYEIKEIVQEDDELCDYTIKYLLDILNDRTIPEENKRLVRKQYDEVIRLKMLSMNPPKIILSRKHSQES